MICLECGQDSDHSHKPKYVEKLYCAFCGAAREAVAFLFKSGTGGSKTCICDSCVDKLAGALAGESSRPVIAGGRMVA